jgi:hypothetical protein
MNVKILIETCILQFLTTHTLTGSSDVGSKNVSTTTKSKKRIQIGLKAQQGFV